uniref:Uncharacterized protein n=1 Tax=Trichobilharzia regenti TaxID=157069 RepID=A0AA85JR43_TRIRE|nr:unnamed protein product [Trichobilharzia regenti]
MNNPVSVYTASVQHHLMNPTYMYKAESSSPSNPTSPNTISSPSIPHHIHTKNYPNTTVHNLFYSSDHILSTTNTAINLSSVLTNSFDTSTQPSNNTFDLLNIRNSTFCSEANLSASCSSSVSSSSSSASSASAASSGTNTASNSTDELPSIQIPMLYSSTSFDMSQHNNNNNIPITSVITTMTNNNNFDSTESLDDVKYSYISNINNHYNCSDLVNPHSSTPLNAVNYANMMSTSPSGNGDEEYHQLGSKKHHHLPAPPPPTPTPHQLQHQKHHPGNETLVTKSSEDLESNSHFAVCSYPSTNSSWKNSKELYLSSINRSVTSPVTSTNTTSDLHSSPTPMNKSGTPDLQSTTNQYIYHNSGLLNSLTNEFIEQKKNDIIKLNTMKQEFEVNSPNSPIQSNPATLTSLTCSTVTTPAEAEVETKITALSTQGLDNSSHEHIQTSWSSCNPEFLKSEYTSQEDSTTSYPLYLNYTIPIGKNTEASCLPVDKVQNSSVKGDLSDNTTTTTNSSNDNISNEKSEANSSEPKQYNYHEHKYYISKNIQNITHKPTYQIALSLTANFYPTVKYKGINSDWEMNNSDDYRYTTQDMSKSTLNPLNPLHSSHLLNEQQQQHEEQLSVTKQNEQISLNMLNSGHLNYYDEHHSLTQSPPNNSNNNNNFDRLPYCNGYNLPSVLPPPCHNPLQHEMKFPPFIMSNYTEQINRNNYYFPDEMQSHESDLTQMNNAKLNYCASSLDTTNTKVSSSTNNSSIVNHEVFEKYNNESYLNAYSAYAENYPQILNYPAESNNHASSTNYTSTYLTNLDKVNNSLSGMNDSRDVFSGGPTQNPLQLSMNHYDSDHSSVHHLSHHHHTHQHDHHSLLQNHPHPHPHHHNQQHSEVTDFNPNVQICL